VEENTTGGLRRDDNRDAHQVGWEGRPGHHADFGDGIAQVRLYDQTLIRANKNVIPDEVKIHSQTTQHKPDHTEMFNASIFNADFAVGHHRGAHKADYLEIIRTDRELSAAQFLHTVYDQRVRTDVFYVGAKDVQQVAELLYMRF